MDMCIALRTGGDQGPDTLYIQAGGGVVYDSDPEAEFMETVNKKRLPKMQACSHGAAIFDHSRRWSAPRG
jgi:anthranilate synthase component 1